MEKNIIDTPVVMITQTIDAPLDQVFKAWTNSRQITKWWGPKDFTNSACEWNARPGGKIYLDMTGPDGTVYPMGGSFLEVTELTRLVFTTTAFHDDTGVPNLEVNNTITFSDENGKIKISLIAKTVKAKPGVEGALKGMKEGWNQSFEKLKAMLEKTNSSL